MLERIKHQLENKSSYILGQEEMKEYAVLIPLIKQENGSLHILFQKRARELRRQPGEVSFPGGKIEQDDPTPEHAAVRESCEELGLNQDNINVIQSLGRYIPARKTIIYPFVAEIKTDNFRPNPMEVENIFQVPLDYFIQTKPQKYVIDLQVQPEEMFPFHLIPGGRNYPWRFGQMEELFYQYQDYVIWGMTARITYHFINLIK